MINKKYLQIIVLALLVLAIIYLTKSNQNNSTLDDFLACQQMNGTLVHVSSESECKISDGQVLPLQIYITKPNRDAVVHSPLQVTGKAKSVWFSSQGQLPFQLKDYQNRIITQGYLQANGALNSFGYIPFSGSFNFDPGSTTYGIIQLTPGSDPEGLFGGVWAWPVTFRTR